MRNDPLYNLPEVPTFEVTSTDFQDGERLPLSAVQPDAAEGGANRSPELSWQRVEGAKSYVVTAYDPDAPTGSGFWHWALRNVPAEVTELPAGAGDPSGERLPKGAVHLKNETREPGFIGAAPPAGHGEHRYVFTVSALDVADLDVPEEATPAVLGFTLREHLLARGQLTGTWETTDREG